MRPLILASGVAALVFCASGSLAAPTCQDENGHTLKCGSSGAMPVGWTPSPQQRLEWRQSSPASPTTGEVLDLICVVGGLFAIIALMPRFDGWGAGDWDRQEGDVQEGAIHDGDREEGR